MGNIIRCQHCNATTTDGYFWSAVTLRNRGGRSAYLCPSCAERLGRYSSKNTNASGKAKAHGYSLGLELETNRPDATARVELMQSVAKGGGFIPTSDATVDVEFKSPVYYSLNPIIAKLDGIQWLCDNEHMRIGDNCGTHLHVGVYDSNENGVKSDDFFVTVCKYFYRPLFKPLADYLFNNPEKCARLFGRELGGWANYPNFTNRDEHVNFINVQHENTLEFRICKFVNKRQYAEAIRFCVDVVKCIDTTVMPYVGGTHAKLERKTTLAGKKFVRLFEKHFAKLDETD